MFKFACEHCGQNFHRKDRTPRRFCSAKCRYHCLAAQGFKPKPPPRPSPETIEKIRIARKRQGGNVWNKGLRGVTTPWNKGLTKATDPRIAAYSVKVGDTQRGKKKRPLSDERKQKLSEQRKGDKNWAKRPEVREKIRRSINRLYQEHPEILANRKPCGRNQFSGTMSSIESPIAEALRRAGVPYVHNAKVDRFWADFLVMGRVVIECDGEYWHDDEAKEQRRADRLADLGYFLFRLPEADILADADACVAKVLRIYEPFRGLELEGVPLPQPMSC